MSTVTVLWKRQLIRYGRSRARVIGSLGQPLLFLVALGFGLGAVVRIAGASYLDFLVPGIVAMTALFTAMFSGIELIWDRQFGFLKETLVAPVSRFSIFLGRTLGGATTSTFQGLVVLAISLALGYRFSLIGLVPAIAFLFLMSLFFTAVGTALATKLQDMQAFPLIINFLVMPLFFLSGALFPLSQAPRALQLVGAIDPLTYAVDALRLTLSGSFVPAPLAVSAAVLGLLTVGFLWLGGRLFETIDV